MIDFTKALRGENAGDRLSPIGALANPLDIESAKKTFAHFEDEIKKVKAKVEKFEITTDDDAVRLTEMVGIVKALIKRIETSRKTTIKDARGFVDGVNKFVRVFRSKLEELEKSGKAKIGQYNYQKEIERRKIEKQMQKEAQAVQAKIDADAKKAGIESVKLPEIKMPQRLEPTRTETAIASTRYRTVYEVVDFAALPDEFKTVDHKKLKAAVDAGLKPAGIVLKEEPIVFIRSN